MLGSRGAKYFKDAHKDLFSNGRMFSNGKTVFTYSLLILHHHMCVSPIVCMLLTVMHKFGDLGVLQESPGVCCFIRMSSYCRPFQDPCRELTTYNTKKDA